MMRLLITVALCLPGGLAWAPTKMPPPSPPPVAIQPKPVIIPVAAPPAPAPRPRTHWVWAIVTACSPDDPGDGAYYEANGYEGDSYNIAADPRQFPLGTLIHVPGYLDRSHPGQFWAVDSHGGPFIRRSARHHVPHIDVKFRTLYSAQQWGTRIMPIEVLDPCP